MLVLIKQKVLNKIAHKVILETIENLQDKIEAIFFMGSGAEVLQKEHKDLLLKYKKAIANNNISIYVCGRALQALKMDVKDLDCDIIVAGYTNLVIESYKTDKLIEF